MGYRIQYGNRKKGRFSRFMVLWGMWFCLFVFATRLWWPVGWERLRAFFPERLLKMPVLWDRLCGELRGCVSWQEAVDTFCQEIGYVF